MEDDLKKIRNGRRTQKKMKKWKMNQKKWKTTSKKKWKTTSKQTKIRPNLSWDWLSSLRLLDSLFI
jgi:hypothetical protein